MKKFFNINIILVILFIACLFRFNNLYWDSNFHLHPDERFLTMVGNAMKLPTSINQYLDQKTSLLNPANIGYNFFVYGRFPLILTKYLAVNLNLDNYNDFTILGRQLSAFFDLLIVILIFKTVALLEKLSVRNAYMRSLQNPSTKYWASFIYAISVLPIQLSHFFAVDTFLNFFMFGSFYFALRFYVGALRAMPLRYVFFSAVFFGLALSCKVTAIFILPLNLFFVGFAYLKRPSRIGKYLLLIFIYLGVSYFTLRLADPYLFQNSNIFDPTISKLFIENIKSLQNMTVKNMDNWFPPMIQWLNKNTVLHSVVNNIVFGLGIPYAILALIGTLKVVLSFPSPFGDRLRRESIPIFIILFWTLGFFVYQSLQITPTLRYFIFLYPFFAIFAGIGIEKVINYVLSIRWKKIICYMLYVTCFIFLLIWPVMFSSIYLHKNTRVEASEWIYKNLPSNSIILGEYWDDPLPLSVLNNYGKQFTIEQLPVFDQDTTVKWQKMNDMLSKADYYVLSSNRGWGSIMDTPIKYPLMSKFYNNLLTNKNPNYKKIKEFTSYPSLKYLGIPLEFPDQWSDEAFTVYDHTKVMIFKNEKK
ncbi:MAG: hypothetical protein AAB437_00260 [Patescibacteria group bacterium]